MSKQFILNLFLLVFVIALAGTIYFSNETPDELETLTRIDPDSISSISISHNNNETRLSKQPDKTWQIEHPITIPANDFRIKAILKLLNAPVHKRYRSSDIDLDSIGLVQAQTVVRFDNIKIAFGITNPITKLRFIRIGEAISTIEDVYFPLINSHFSTLVSLDLLPDGDIEKLILVNQTISRDSQARWQSNIDITADAIAGAVDAWQNSQAFGVHQYLERKQLGDVFVTLKGQSPIRFQITDTDPWLVLAREDIGLEYHLDSETYDSLLAPQDAVKPDD